MKRVLAASVVISAAAVFLGRGRLSGLLDQPETTGAQDVGIIESTLNDYMTSSVENSNNRAAMLQTIIASEGTNRSDPYSVCYGYRHVIQDFSDHPALTGEWAGELLSDAMCRGAGLGAGCRSTAAGAYQITKPTWRRLKTALNLPDFSPDSQDQAAIQLIKEAGALNDVDNGNIESAINKCRRIWASLPGAGYGQGERSLSFLLSKFQTFGGVLA